MNIKNILNSGQNILQQNKISNAQLDAEILLSCSIKKDKKHIILNPNEILRTDQINKFNNLIERRKKGEPIA